MTGLKLRSILLCVVLLHISAAPIFAQDSPALYEDLGCFQDVTDLDRDLGVRVEEGDGSIDNCYSATADYSYFGLQAGGQCWAGQSFGKYGDATTAGCDTACTENSEQTCGGEFVTEVFQRGSFVIPSTTPEATPDTTPFPFSVTITNAYTGEGNVPTVLVCEGYVNVSWTAPPGWGSGSIGIYFGDTSKTFLWSVPISESDGESGFLSFDLVQKLGLLYYDDETAYIVGFYVGTNIETFVTFKFASGVTTNYRDYNGALVVVNDGSQANPDAINTEKIIRVGWTTNSACPGPDVIGIFDFKARPAKAQPRKFDGDLADFIAYVNPGAGQGVTQFTIKNLNPDIGFEDPIWAVQYFINVRGTYIFGDQSPAFRVVTADRTLTVKTAPGFLGKPCLANEKFIEVTFTAPKNRADNDLIAVFDNSNPDFTDPRIFLDYKYVPSDGRTTSGVVTIKTTTLKKGVNYAVRYLLADGYWQKAQSADFVLCPKDRTISIVNKDGQPPVNGVFKLASPNSIYVNITMPADHSENDWIAIYQKDTCETDLYCQLRNVDVKRAGQTRAIIGPIKTNRLTPGLVYFARYNLNDGYTVAATSEFFTVPPALPGTLPDPGLVSNYACAWGDPHYVSFDGVSTTFPECGIQVLVRPRGTNPGHSFHLQAVHSRPVAMLASIISSLAVKCSASQPKIIFSATPTTTTITVNDKAVTIAVGKVGTYSGVKITAQKANKFKVECGTGTELTVIRQKPAKSNTGYLEIGYIKLAAALKGKVEGLLGIWDGDLRNDLLWSSGQLATAAQRAQFTKWITTQGTPPAELKALQNSWNVDNLKGTTASLFPAYKVACVAGTPPSLKALGDGKKACASKINKTVGFDFDACVFDYAVTKDLTYVSNGGDSLADRTAIRLAANPLVIPATLPTPTTRVATPAVRTAVRTATKAPTPTPGKPLATATKVPSRLPSQAPTRVRTGAPTKAVPTKGRA